MKPSPRHVAILSVAQIRHRCPARGAVVRIGNVDRIVVVPERDADEIRNVTTPLPMTILPDQRRLSETGDRKYHLNSP